MNILYIDLNTISNQNAKRSREMTHLTDEQIKVLKEVARYYDLPITKPITTK